MEERANSVFSCFEKNASKVWSFETAVYLFKCLSNLEIFILLYSYSFIDAYYCSKNGIDSIFLAKITKIVVNTLKSELYYFVPTLVRPK